jgi:site-specific DNA-methyltransferase (adenine-specific)
MAENVLYYGDNLEILRRYIEDESVDLVYLDPPFKSNQDYNILFAERNGSQAAAKIPDEKTKIQRFIAATNSQIDKLVYSLYGLTPEEIKIIEESTK